MNKILINLGLGLITLFIVVMIIKFTNMNDFQTIIVALIFALLFGGLPYLLYKKGYGRVQIWTRGLDYYRKGFFLFPYTKSTISEERQFLKWQSQVILIGIPLGIIIGVILKLILYW